MKKIIKLWSIITITLIPTIFVISCGSKLEDFKKEKDIKNLSISSHNKWDNKKANSSNWFNKEDNSIYNNRYLSDEFYNMLREKLKHNKLEFVIIANKNIYVEIIEFKKEKETLWDAAKRLQYLKLNSSANASGMGIFVSTFKYRSKTNESWENINNMHGESETKNYNDYYPLFYINHSFALLGVSNWTTHSNEIYEITYDHN